jgi:hypothetical protein
MSAGCGWSGAAFALAAVCLVSVAGAADTPPSTAGVVRDLGPQQAPADSARDAAAARAGPAVPPPVPVTSDTSLGAGPRVPGTVLRMGEGYARSRRRPGFAPTENVDAAASAVMLAGPLRFFGVDGRARTTFDPSGLSRVTWTMKPLAPHQRDYIEDQLRRLGYRPRCQYLDVNRRECDWVGELQVHVKCDTVMMTAEVVRAGAAPSRDLHLHTEEDRERAAFDTRLRPYLDDPTPILADTLTLDPAAPPGRHAAPVLMKTVPPVYDDALRARGIVGVVPVLALVGLDGSVQFTRADEGPKELRSIALENVSQYRFGGYFDSGKRVRFWVWIPVRFGV